MKAKPPHPLLFDPRVLAMGVRFRSVHYRTNAGPDRKEGSDRRCAGAGLALCDPTQAGLLRQLRGERSLHERFHAGRACSSNDRRLCAARAGRQPDQAQAELKQIASRLHVQYPAAYPESRGFDVVVTPWKDELTAKARPTLMILLGTTVLVLIIACANVANLTLTRLVQRSARWRFVPRLELSVQASGGTLAENTVLSVFGGLLGIGLAVACLSLLVAYTARFTTRTGEIGLDGWVLAFTLAISIGAAMLFAWAPRLTFMTDPVRSMSSGAGGRATGGIGRRRAQRALVVSQLAVSFMLLIGAGLLIRSLMELYAVDPGFDLSNVLSLQSPDFSPFNRDKQLQFTRTLVDQVKQQPTVESAAMALSAPLQVLIRSGARSGSTAPIPIPVLQRRCLSTA